MQDPEKFAWCDMRDRTKEDGSAIVKSEREVAWKLRQKKESTSRTWKRSFPGRNQPRQHGKLTARRVGLTDPAPSSFLRTRAPCNPPAVSPGWSLSREKASIALR